MEIGDKLDPALVRSVGSTSRTNSLGQRKPAKTDYYEGLSAFWPCPHLPSNGWLCQICRPDCFGCPAVFPEFWYSSCSSPPFDKVERTSSVDFPQWSCGQGSRIQYFFALFHLPQIIGHLVSHPTLWASAQGN